MIKHSDFFNTILKDINKNNKTLIGVTGPISVGKSVFSNDLKKFFEKKGLKTDVVSVDGFIYDNKTLEEKNIFKRKGFPESYNIEKIKETFSKIKENFNEDIFIPYYSQELSDIDKNSSQTIHHDSDIIIFEGISLNFNELHKELDTSIFLDSSDKIIVSFFLERTIKNIMNSSEEDFYYQFKQMSIEDMTDSILKTWKETNQKNIDENIRIQKDNYDFNVFISSEHNIEKVKTKDK